MLNQPEDYKPNPGFMQRFHSQDPGRRTRGAPDFPPSNPLSEADFDNQQFLFKELRSTKDLIVCGVVKYAWSITNFNIAKMQVRIFLDFDIVRGGHFDYHGAKE